MKIENWGEIAYPESVIRQLEAVEAIAEGAEERLILCTHPPVVTLGRGSSPEDIEGWNGDIFESSRGGRATYHGPSQLVIYPIVNLKQARPLVPERDIHSYLRTLEQATVQGLTALGVKGAEARTTKVGANSLTGVWVGENKVASIGIAVKKWVSYHGVAINVQQDANAFQGIKPCGYSKSVMTSLEELLDKPSPLRFVNWVFARSFLSLLEN